MKSGYCGCDQNGHRGRDECPRWIAENYFLYKIHRVAGPGKAALAAPRTLSNEEIDWLIGELKSRRRE